MTIRPGIPARPRRRTQQERRDTTREALLDATIDCLAQSGFASLTLARVSERAGLTVGAHLHHFKTRTALVAAAMERLAERRLGEVRNLDAEHLAPGDLLDIMWDLHSGDLYHAALDLWAAARTDPELRNHLVLIEKQIDDEIAAIIGRLPAAYAEHPEFADTVKVALATIRGLAMRDCLHPERDRDAEWQQCRQYLVTMLTPD